MLLATGLLLLRYLLGLLLQLDYRRSPESTCTVREETNADERTHTDEGDGTLFKRKVQLVERVYTKRVSMRRTWSGIASHLP